MPLTASEIKKEAQEADAILDSLATKLADLADATDLTPDGRDAGDILSGAAQMVTRARTTLHRLTLG